MADVTISQTEYEKLERQAKAYQEVATAFFTSLLRQESIEEMVADFRQTGLYEESFLQDLEAGLKKSSLGSPHDHQTATT